MTKTTPLCIYHGHCADGFAAALTVWEFFSGGVDLYAANHGDPHPSHTLYEGRVVIIVDFSYSANTLRHMADHAHFVLVLDHHKSAAEALESLPKIVDIHPVYNALQGKPFEGSNLFAQFDMNRSGAMMAWDFFFPGSDAPRLIRYVQDRDLWQHKLPLTKEVNAALSTVDMNIADWRHFSKVLMMTDGLDLIADRGTAVLAMQAKHHDSIIGQGLQEMMIGGHYMKVVNCPGFYASDVVGKLAEASVVGVAASYYDSDDKRHFSLRARGKNGPDVSAIAVQYGGGGHAAAAGFTMPLGWKGETPE